MITKIFLLSTIIHLINGQGLQTGSAAQPQSNKPYVFDLPPLQIQPLQIKVMPSESTLFLVRQNDKQQMEFIPIDQYEQQNSASAIPNPRQNQIPSVVNNIVSKPVPQVVPQALPQPAPQTKSRVNIQLPKESSVEYDVPSVQSVLKDLSHYVPYQLPDLSLLYQQSIPTQTLSTQSVASQAQPKNARVLPPITLPAVTLQDDGVPVQTIAVELPSQTLPTQTITESQIIQSIQASLAKAQTAQTIPIQTLQTQTPATPAPTAQPVQAEPLTIQTLAAPAPTARPIQAKPLPAPVPTAQPLSLQPQGIQALVLPTQTATAQPLLSNDLPKQQIVFIQTFAEAGKAVSPLALFPTAAPTIKPIKPTLESNIKPSPQKPITTEIRRSPILNSVQSQTLPSSQPQILALNPIQTTQIQTDLLNNPTILLLDNNQPYSFGFDIVDPYGNQQSRKEEISTNGVVTGSYKYTDANGLSRQVEYIADENGAGIGTNEPGTSGLSPAGVKVSSNLINSKLTNFKPINPTTKPTKKPILLQANQSAAIKKISFSQKHHV